MKRLREVAVRHLLTYALLPPPAMLLLWMLYARGTANMPVLLRVLLLLAAIVVSYYLTKRFAIGLVLVYKAFAPLSVRERCLFTPTCSTYMIMAINQYGLFLGVYKGIRRLLRCKPPNGGEDYP